MLSRFRDVTTNRVQHLSSLLRLALRSQVMFAGLRRDSLAAMLAQLIARCMRHVIALPRKIPDYARKLGFFRGFYALLASDLGMGLVKVKVPGITSSVKIRPRTSDRYAFEQIFLDDDYALPMGLQPRFVIDGGANVGYASIYFSNRYPNADIVAVEPDPSKLCGSLREC